MNIYREDMALNLENVLFLDKLTDSYCETINLR